MSAVAMQSFGFGDQLVRVTDRDGAPWFIGMDVCAALEIANSRQAISRLDDDERDTVISNDAVGRTKEMVVVSESGMFSLVLGSRKASAKAFKRWVTHDVLPALRKTGRYEMPGAENDDDDDDGALSPRDPFLGTHEDRHALRVAMLMVQRCESLYGQYAGRQLWQQLGFPTPELMAPAAPVEVRDTAPAIVHHATAPKVMEREVIVQAEGDLVRWEASVGLKASKTDATHLRDLLESYRRWCSVVGDKPMEPMRAARWILNLYGTEEHPEMVKAVMTRR